MAYTSQSIVEAFLKRDLTRTEELLLPLMITMVDEYIDRQLGGSFGSVAASTRYYDGGNQILDIDPAQNVTKVAYTDPYENELYIYIFNYDFELRPRNAPIKRWVENRFSTFPSGVANVAVTAEFTLGNDTPKDIEYLSTYLLSQLFNKQEVGNLKSESIEGYSRTFNDFVTDDGVVKTVLAKYTNDIILV